MSFNTLIILRQELVKPPLIIIGRFDDAEDLMAIFPSTLPDIAADNIPKTFPFPERKTKPCFDKDCEAAKMDINKGNRLIKIVVL